MPQLGEPITDPDLIKALEGAGTSAQTLSPVAAPNQYTGKVLPFSVNPEGKTEFDSNAGVLGMARGLGRTIASAVTAPGQAYLGELPTPYSGAPPDQAINRAIDFASVFSPQSAAYRAGEIIPGEFAAKAGAPSAQQLKQAAGAGYEAARNSGLEMAPSSVANMAERLRDALNEKGFIAENAPTTHAIIGKLTDPPTGAVGVSTTGLDAARRAFGNVSTTPSDQAAAGIARRAIDEYSGALAPQDIVAGTATPEQADAVAQTLRAARGNYAAAQKSNDLVGGLDRGNTGLLERADARAAAANSGHNIGNTIRQRVASFLQNDNNLGGFSQAEIDALNKAVEGGKLQNFAREVANRLGGGGGIMATGIGSYLGSHFGPYGAAMGAAAFPMMGLGAKAVENGLARHGLQAVDEMVRMNSPLYQALGSGVEPAMGRSGAVLRSLLPGLFAPSAQMPGSLAPPTGFDWRNGA